MDNKNYIYTRFLLKNLKEDKPTYILKTDDINGSKPLAPYDKFMIKYQQQKQNK